MKELPKTYNPKQVEDGIYQKWEASGFFAPEALEPRADNPNSRKTFSIAMPPPNITAELHVGQAMFLSIQDLMIRHARMSGKKTLWLPGTDHAAIATQNVVERQIWEQGKKTRHDLGRDELLKRIEEFVAKTRGRIQVQIRKMGSSCDWSREKYTLSEELSLAVRTVFKKMYEAGLIYRGDRIVNWCPRCGTTLADDEVEYKETRGNLYHIKYPLAKSKSSLTIATTRPETMLGDTAVAVHPDDKRYQKYVGQTVMLPLVNRELEIIADPHVDREFGTGVLKVTPGHDPHDSEIGERHKLEIINIFTLDGKINEEEAINHGFEKYAGLPIAEARERIVRDLEENGFLDKTEDITHSIGGCYRCGTAVEPIVSKQWFLKVNAKFKVQNAKFKNLLKLDNEASLKEIGTAAVKSGAIKIIPERFTKIYLQWMENLRDWNISRQIWFGHRIPVWYCLPSHPSPGEGRVPEAGEVAKMGFHESIVPKVFQGKTKTYRIRDHGLKVGDKVAFENSQTGEIFGYGILNNVEQTTVGKIKLGDPAHMSDYKTTEELIAAFKRLNPDHEVNKNTAAYIYAYEFHPQEKVGDTCGQIIVSVEEPEKCPGCGNVNLSQDPDTLDTWFSSSLWTFSTLGWPKYTEDLKLYHPTTILETGYDILFFWVARMILMTGFAISDIPFKTVYLHGLVRDKQGKKMSKSEGNVINPLNMIEQFGTDALRLSLIMGTTPGNDMKLYPEKVAAYRNFANKLWNIARFILQNSPSLPATSYKLPASPAGRQATTLADQWILAELDNLIATVNQHLANYQYGLAGEELENFTWNKFADWYLEIAKLQMQNEKQKESTHDLLTYVLTSLLKLWHPFIPFITEHIWSQFSETLLMVEEYPTSKKIDTTDQLQVLEKRVVQFFYLLRELITGLRNLRAEYKEAPSKILAAYLELPKGLEWIKEQTPIIERLARVKLNLETIPRDKKMPYFLWPARRPVRRSLDEGGSLGGGGENTKVYLIIADFDPKKERQLAEKELKEVEARVKALDKQLAKNEFLKKAPTEVVEKIKADFEAIREREVKLKEKLKTLK